MSVLATRLQIALNALIEVADLGADMEDECPYCGAYEKGFSSDHNELSRADETESQSIDYFHIEHEESCPIAIAQKALTRNHELITGKTVHQGVGSKWQ